MCFGRIHPDKGTAEAIAIARAAERPLVLCGPVQDERYFAEEVEPHVDGDRVRYLGSVGPAERAEVLGAAALPAAPDRVRRAVRARRSWSRCCAARPSSPTRAGRCRRSSTTGVTGVSRPDVASAVAAVERAASFDRAACRRAARRRFSADRMVDDYLRVYESVLRDR